MRGEPIVCTPEDAYRCFMRTKMDYLVLGNFIIDKTAQPEPADDVEWMKEFDPTWFQTTLSVPANLKGMFEPMRLKVVKNGSAKKDKKG